MQGCDQFVAVDDDIGRTSVIIDQAIDQVLIEGP
jgi:hypothetical protein